MSIKIMHPSRLVLSLRPALSPFHSLLRKQASVWRTRHRRRTPQPQFPTRSSSGAVQTLLVQQPSRSNAWKGLAAEHRLRAVLLIPTPASIITYRGHIAVIKQILNHHLNKRPFVYTLKAVLLYLPPTA